MMNLKILNYIFYVFIFYHDMVYFRSLIKTIAKNKD